VKSRILDHSEFPSFVDLHHAEDFLQRVKRRIAATEDKREKAQLAINLMRAKRRLAKEKAAVEAWVHYGKGNFEEPPEDTKTYHRWSAVAEARRKGLSWKDAYNEASKTSQGTRYRGQPATMKRDYQIVQRLIREAEKWVKKIPPNIWLGRENTST
jgi:hypothetical protein